MAMLCLLLLAGNAFGDGDHANESKKQAHKEVDSHDDDQKPAVEISDKQRKFLNIKLAQALSGNLENYLELPGEIQLNADHTANMMPKMPGFVTEVLVSEGDAVKKGQILARITSHKLGEYFSAHKLALEREKIAKTEFEMAKTLYEKTSMSQKEYLRYQKDYADSIVERERAEIMLKSLNINGEHETHTAESKTETPLLCTLYEVKAPWDGTILKKFVTVGENFAEDNTKVIFVVSDVSHLWVDLKADEFEIARIAKGMPVQIKTSASTEIHNGKIIYVAPVIDEVTRTGLVRVSIENHDGNLRAGTFATGTVKLRDKGESVLIPGTAIQLVGGEFVVFVPVDDGFSPRDVRTGKSANGYTQIVAGLKVGEKYVSEGAFGLKAILVTSGMTGDGHGH